MAAKKPKEGFMPCPYCKSPQACRAAGRCLKAAKK